MSVRRQAPAALTSKTLPLLGVLVLVTISALYVLLPALAGLKDAWGRISDGDARWLFPWAGVTRAHAHPGPVRRHRDRALRRRDDIRPRPGERGREFNAAPNWAARLAPAAAAAPTMLGTGVRGVLSMTRACRPELGALGWWLFDIAVLFASLRAFGGDAQVAVVVTAYFVGMLANTLPVPGGIGAVDGGMIGALIGFGVDAGLAIVAVLTYRLFAFWLPIGPGIVAYLQLLREEPAPGR